MLAACSPRLDVGAGVTAVAHGEEVEQGRSATTAHPVGEILGDVVHGDRIRAVNPLVPQIRPMGERGLDPTGRSRHADPPAVVLTHEEQRHRHALVGGVRRRIQRPCAVEWFSEASPKLVTRWHRRATVPRPRAGVPDRWQARRPSLAAGAARWSRSAVGRRDRHGRTPCGVRRRSARQQTPAIRAARAHAVVPGYLARPRQVEAARSVVQEGRIGRSQRVGDEGVRLMSGRPDRVESRGRGHAATAVWSRWRLSS